jgi:hypothetical protein
MIILYLTFFICLANALRNVPLADEERIEVLQRLCKLYAEANGPED